VNDANLLRIHMYNKKDLRQGREEKGGRKERKRIKTSVPCFSAFLFTPCFRHRSYWVLGVWSLMGSKKSKRLILIGSRTRYLGGYVSLREFPGITYPSSVFSLVIPNQLTGLFREWHC